MESEWAMFSFQELLNPTNMYPQGGTESGDQEVDHPISGAEVAEVVKPLPGGGAPGRNEIRPGYLKALDVVGLSWLTRLCNIAWTSGAVPLDWQTGVVVPIFKSGDQRVCYNYRGITLLSLPNGQPLKRHQSQLGWLGHLARMPSRHLPLEVFRTCPTGRRPCGRPRTRYISHLAWERLGVPPEELMKVAGERAVWASLLKLLPPRPVPG
ncbi:hypothetical protein D4764_17G0006860 [Takifugu flavidus]|uniref:Uncharacterized protein n=1 Tax=Takifugu flavidus TaxID=433684 RepID=A0A5C6NV60_9TELE|nr:hypothetical protein D4764_17G0006860 [Takifugu flavidus]